MAKALGYNTSGSKLAYSAVADWVAGAANKLSGIVKYLRILKQEMHMEIESLGIAMEIYGKTIAIFLHFCQICALSGIIHRLRIKLYLSRHSGKVKSRT